VTKQNIFLIIIILTLSGCVQKQPLSARIDKTVGKYVSDNRLNGSVIIACKDSVIFTGSFGYANFNTMDTITTSTIFATGSVTKQFTATAIMILQEKGLLSIDDSIGKYIEVPSAMQNIPIKYFMCMTSGIPNYVENDIAFNKDSVLAFHFKTDTVYFPANTRFHYNNSNYFFLGLLIENVSGMTYPDFMKENIFNTAGMKNTFAYNGNKIKRAIGYDENRDENDFLITSADGCILSTVNDLALWNKALFGDKILTNASREIMFESRKTEDGTDINYGLGWEINNIGKSSSLFNIIISKCGKGENDYKNKYIVSHTGNISSFGAYNQYDTVNDISVILLTNQVNPALINLIGEINSEIYDVKSVRN